MKQIALTSLAIVAMIGSLAQAQAVLPPISGTTRLPVRPDSRLWIEGTSTLRDWSCEAVAVEAAIDIAGDAAQLDGALDLRRVQVRVPVSALRCGNSQMDRTMNEALTPRSAREATDIVALFDVTASDGDSDIALRANGSLRIAGREQTVRLNVFVQALGDGALRAQGSLPIRMTDYGITPPTAFFGILRADDRIVVKFDLVIDTPTSVASVRSQER